MMEQVAHRRLAISTAPANLLQVFVDVWRHLVVYNEPDVGFIDTHSKCHCRDDDLDIFVLPGLLDLGPFILVSASVIIIAVDAVVLEPF